MAYWWIKPLLFTVFAAVLILLFVARFLDAAGVKNKTVLGLIGISVGILALLGLFFTIVFIIGIWMNAIPA